MDIFEERYFNFNRKIFVYMGLWPFGTKMKIIIRKYFTLSVLFVFAIPHVISLIVNFSDIDRAMLNLVMIFIAVLMFLKALAIIIAEDKMKKLYQNIAKNWLNITDKKEKKILIKYSERGRKITLFYFAFTQIGAVSLFALPTTPKILDMISPLQNPRQNVHILEGEMFLDRETYYILYYLLDVISVIITSIVSVSIDTMYIMCVEHCCAMYAIIQYRLCNLMPAMIDSSTEAADGSYTYVIGIIQLHQNTLDLTTTINGTFSLLFLYIFIANLATIPLNAVTVLSNLDELYNFIRFGILFIILVIHLFMLSWPGQNVLDHGIELTKNAYCNEWYGTSIHTTKIILIFMIRCTRPNVLTAGDLMLMNFQNFSMIVRTAASYITVVASFR